MHSILAPLHCLCVVSTKLIAYVLPSLYIYVGLHCFEHPTMQVAGPRFQKITAVEGTLFIYVYCSYCLYGNCLAISVISLSIVHYGVSL